MRDFRTDNSGATSIEYALIASLIALIIITGVTAVGGKTSSLFNTISSKLK